MVNVTDTLALTISFLSLIVAVIAVSNTKKQPTLYSQPEGEYQPAKGTPAIIDGERTVIVSTSSSGDTLVQHVNDGMYESYHNLVEGHRAVYLAKVTKVEYLETEDPRKLFVRVLEGEHKGGDGYIHFMEEREMV